jgi:hypothetical protein
MQRRPWILAALCCIAAGSVNAAPAPDWTASITDVYVGREWNAGEMACARTAFTLQGGALVGHYWIGDADPFEGDLDQFVPGAGHSGVFTWTDRYGQGSLYVRFGEDGQTFFSLWGDDPAHMNHAGYGLRGALANVPGCGGATS